MNIAHLINHPEELNKETLYELRTITAQHPYYQPALLMLIRNLYLLHDPSFQEELQRAAIYITDRTKLFDLVEGMHYQILRSKEKEVGGEGQSSTPDPRPSTSKTINLIDNFLDSLPEEYKEDQKPRRKPTAADATVDYVAYLLDTEEQQDNTPQLKGQSLIDDFINEGGKFTLNDNDNDNDNDNRSGINQSGKDSQNENESDDEYFTETLARIYIQQKRYSKALEIIQRLNLVYPKKSRYFADQIRFLEKLILNDNKKQIRK